MGAGSNKGWYAIAIVALLVIGIGWSKAAAAITPSQDAIDTLGNAVKPEAAPAKSVQPKDDPKPGFYFNPKLTNYITPGRTTGISVFDYSMRIVSEGSVPIYGGYSTYCTNSNGAARMAVGNSLSAQTHCEPVWDYCQAVSYAEADGIYSEGQTITCYGGPGGTVVVNKDRDTFPSFRNASLELNGTEGYISFVADNQQGGICTAHFFATIMTPGPNIPNAEWQKEYPCPKGKDGDVVSDRVRIPLDFKGTDTVFYGIELTSRSGISTAKSDLAFFDPSQKGKIQVETAQNGVPVELLKMVRGY